MLYCLSVPSGYEASYSADIFYTRVENSIANETRVINYTLTMDNNHFGGAVFQVALSLIDTRRTEMYFRLSGGSLSRTYTAGISPELVNNDPITFISDSVIIINTPEQRIPVDTFSFELGATIIGSNFRVTQTGSRGVVGVIESAGKTKSAAY